RSLGSSADGGESGVDLLVTCRAAGVFFIEETFPTTVISETITLGHGFVSRSEDEPRLDEIVNRQRRQAIEKLYGDRLRVGIGQVTEYGSRLIVPFSVMSWKSEAIELVPPPVQLAGQ